MSPASGVSTRSDQRVDGHRTVLEMLAVLLLGIGSVATAWCGFQASHWMGEEAKQSRNAGIARTRESQLFGLGTQKFAYDATMTTQYAQAVSSGDVKVQKFLRDNLVRPEFLPVLDEWEARIAAGSPPGNLFDNTKYTNSLFVESRAAAAEGDAALALAEEASQNGDDYLLMTLLTATVLFFAGVTTSFSSRPARLALLSVAGIALALAASRLADLPVI